MNRLYLFTYIIITLLFALQACNGQSISTGGSVQKNGAIGDTVTQTADSILVIYHAKDNTYWFGSNGRGVYHYNDKTLIQYTTKHGLSNNQVWDIKEDKAGNIYIGTADGVNKYDGKTITQLKVAQTNTEWKLEPGDLWFENGIDHGQPYRYDGKNLYRLTFPKNIREDEFNAKFPTTGYTPYHIYTIYTDSKGRIWFGTAVLGVGCYDGKAFTWIAEDDLTEIHDGPSNGVRSIIEDKNGDFWFSTFYRYTITQNPAGGITYERKKGINFPKEFKLDGFEYLSATVDTTGTIWIATFNDGVWQYDGKTVTHYPVTNSNGNVTLFTVYKDKQGTLWLGTHTDGVYKWNGAKFEKFRF